MTSRLVRDGLFGWNATELGGGSERAGTGGQVRAFASDPDRLCPFEQEARTVAALNHRDILAVFDAGTWALPGELDTDDTVHEPDALREMFAFEPNHLLTP